MKVHIEFEPTADVIGSDGQMTDTDQESIRIYLSTFTAAWTPGSTDVGPVAIEVTQ